MKLRVTLDVRRIVGLTVATQTQQIAYRMRIAHGPRERQRDEAGAITAPNLPDAAAVTNPITRICP
jgi:hypothetical protein